WSTEGASLAVLRGMKAADRKQRENVLVAWSNLGKPKIDQVVYDPSKDASFPKGMVLSEFSSPRFSRDGSRLFVGIKEQETDSSKREACSERSDCEPQANVDVWHWKDPDPQSVQLVRIQQLRRTTTPAAIVLATKRFVKLGSD